MPTGTKILSNLAYIVKQKGAGIPHRAKAAGSPARRVMISTTTNSIEGRQIGEYLGLVTGEAIMGANIFRDFLAGITDMIGGRSDAYEGKLADARETAIREMEEIAQRRGADAVVGIDIDYEVLGSSNGMLMVTATGTAVKLK